MNSLEAEEAVLVVELLLEEKALFKKIMIVVTEKLERSRSRITPAGRDQWYPGEGECDNQRSDFSQFHDSTSNSLIP